MQIVLFLTLGLLVFPSRIIPVIGIGLVISAFIIIVARPLSVFISLIPFKVQTRSKWLISWVGLRGAVPIVFATYPLVAGVEKAHMIFNIVFFISLTSVLIQGTSLPLIAKWLRLTLPEKVKQRTQTDIELADSIKDLLMEVILSDQSTAIGKQIVKLALPKTAFISIIQRGGKYITPNGSTVLEEGDRLYILSENSKDMDGVYNCLGMERNDFEEKI
jgi:cell volume regulation protein A